MVNDSLITTIIVIGHEHRSGGVRLFDQLKEDLQSDDWSTALTASDQLARIGGPEALTVLIPLLSSPSRLTRNAVALALRDIGDNAAREPLIQAIAAPLSHDDRGTLVYALETLDCRDYLRFLFHLTLTGNFEVQSHALHILHEQEFAYTRGDLIEMQVELDSYALRKDRPLNSEVLIDELVTLLKDLCNPAQETEWRGES
jgi:HEAT repeat protein